MKQLTVKIDASIPIQDIARALATIGCTISSDGNGEMRVSKRRVRAARPEGKKAEKK